MYVVLNGVKCVVINYKCAVLNDATQNTPNVMNDDKLINKSVEHKIE